MYTIFKKVLKIFYHLVKVQYNTLLCPKSLKASFVAKNISRFTIIWGFIENTKFFLIKDLT